MEVIKAGECFLVTRLGGTSAEHVGGYSPYLLGRVIDRPGGRPNEKMIVHIGYLRAMESSDFGSASGASAGAENSSRYRFSFLEPGLERQLMEAVFNGTLEASSTGSGTTSQQLLYVAYHQAFSRVCMGSYSGDTRVYQYTDFRYISSEHEYIKTTHLYQEYISATVRVKAPHFDRYASFAGSIPIKLFLEGAETDMHWTSYANLMEQRAENFAIASRRFLETEGCMSERAQTYETNLHALIN